MHPGITGSIIDIDLALFVHNGPVGKHHVGYIANPFLLPWPDQKSGRFCDHPGGILQIRGKGIDHVAESCRRVPYPVGNVDPAPLCPDGNGSRSVFRLRDGMVFAKAGHFLLIDHRMGNVLAQAKTDTAARTGVDKIVHGSCVKSILPVHELRMEHNISLLGRTERHKVRKPLPFLQILCPYNTGGRHGCRQVACRGILALGTEHAVNVTVLMLCQPHIVNIRLLRAGVRKQDGIVPETKAVHSVVTFRHAKEGFPIVPLDSGHQIIFPIQINCSRIHHRIDSKPLHKVRICLRIQVILPGQGDMLSGEHRISVPVVHPIVKIRIRLILSAQQGFLLFQLFLIPFVKHFLPPSALPLFLSPQSTSFHCGKGISRVPRWVFPRRACRFRPPPRTTPSLLFCQSDML